MLSEPVCNPDNQFLSLFFVPRFKSIGIPLQCQCERQNLHQIRAPHPRVHDECPFSRRIAALAAYRVTQGGGVGPGDPRSGF